MHKSVQAIWQIRETGDEMATPSTIEVPKGERVVLAVEVLRNDGTIPDLRSSTVQFRMVDWSGSLVHRTHAEGTILGTVTLTVLLPASLGSGSYAWDLWLTTASGERYQIKPLGAFVVQDSSFASP